MSTSRITSYTRAGLTFDVSDTGPLDGPVVVLLHGFPGSHRTWNGVTPLLNDAGFRTVAPDQRGYSPRARPRRRRAYRAKEVTDDVITLIDALGRDRVHVVGHDWGGFVAWRLAAVASDRLSGMTVLSTPHPSALLRSLFSSAQALRSVYIGLFQLPRLPEALLRPRLERLLRESGLPHTYAREYARLLREPRALTSALNWYRGMWLPRRQARAARPGPVPVDTTYAWGNRDQALGRRAAELTHRFVGAHYRFVEVDETHWLPERAPRLVADLVRSAHELSR